MCGREDLLQPRDQPAPGWLKGTTAQPGFMRAEAMAEPCGRRRKSEYRSIERASSAARSRCTDLRHGGVNGAGSS